MTELFDIGILKIIGVASRYEIIIVISLMT